MIRSIPGLAVAAIMFLAPAMAVAQQPAPSDSVSTYSDTLPKHKSSAKPASLKTSSGKTGSKTHKTGKSHKSSKGKSGKGTKANSAG